LKAGSKASSMGPGFRRGDRGRGGSEMRVDDNTD
jgi:hypothetical protein